jgi:hypothetical protein
MGLGHHSGYDDDQVSRLVTMDLAGVGRGDRRRGLLGYQAQVTGTMTETGSTRALTRVTTLSVLKILNVAGDAGERSGDIARQFTSPEKRQRRAANVNTLLARLAKHHYVYRADAPEPSPHYHNIPVYRWFITDEGKRYLRAGGYEGTNAAARTRQSVIAERKSRAQERYRKLLAGAHVLAGSLSPGCGKERNDLIIKLRYRGLTFTGIGLVFGISRERVRQIVNGINVNPCRCQKCVSTDERQDG